MYSLCSDLISMIPAHPFNYGTANHHPIIIKRYSSLLSHSVPGIKGTEVVMLFSKNVAMFDSGG